ncbi:MAG TPA: terminase small subunit, partial [Ruminococcus sp.]|nr:terminase small subunit [Ruminococcus sp.]
MKSLNDMQKLFCCNYVKLGNVGEAAVKAGFSPETALMDGMECLENKACRRLISRLKKSCYSGSAEIISGLERLAFGSCNDAV